MNPSICLDRIESLWKTASAETIHTISMIPMGPTNLIDKDIYPRRFCSALLCDNNIILFIECNDQVTDSKIKNQSHNGSSRHHKLIFSHYYDIWTSGTSNSWIIRRYQQNDHQIEEIQRINSDQESKDCFLCRQGL